MPLPTPGDVHVNIPLSNISIAYLQSLDEFVADKVFPLVPSDKQSNRYYTYDRADWMRSQAQVRAPASESAGGGWRVDNTPNFFCIPIAIHKDIDDQTRSNADPVINMDRDATEWVTRQMALKREIDFTTKFFTTGVWTGATGVGGGADGADIVGGGAAGSNTVKYWDTTGSLPIQDIWTQQVGIKRLTGYKPNVLLIGPFVLKALVNHADVLDRIKYTQRGVVDTDILASLFSVEKVMVAWGVKATSAEGVQQAAGAATASPETFDFIFGKHAMLCYAAPSPGLMVPSAGYTFSWTGYLGAGAAGNRIKRFRMEPLASDRVEGEMSYDQKMIGSDLGMIFANVVQ